MTRKDGIPTSELILSDYFHLRSTEVAEIYGMGRGKFREYCMMRGIKKWPANINNKSIKFIKSDQFDPRNYQHLSVAGAAKQLNVSTYTYRKYCKKAGFDVRKMHSEQKRPSVSAIEFLKSDKFDPRDYAHLTIGDAAKKLDVSVDTLRKYCHLRGIYKWPKSINLTDHADPAEYNEIIDFILNDSDNAEICTDALSLTDAQFMTNISIPTNTTFTNNDFAGVKFTTLNGNDSPVSPTQSFTNTDLANDEFTTVDNSNYPVDNSTGTNFDHMLNDFQLDNLFFD